MNHHIHFIQQVKFKRNSYFSYSRGYGSKELITTTPFKFFKSVSVRSQKNADLSELLPLRLVQKYIHQIEMEHKGWTCFKAPYIPCHGMTMLSWDVFFQCLFTTQFDSWHAWELTENNEPRSSTNDHTMHALSWNALCSPHRMMPWYEMTSWYQVSFLWITCM